MWLNENNIRLDDLIKEIVTRHLTLESNWYGNPTTSEFGISIGLAWDNNIFNITNIDFFDENKK